MHTLFVRELLFIKPPSTKCPLSTTKKHKEKTHPEVLKLWFVECDLLYVCDESQCGKDVFWIVLELFPNHLYTTKCNKCPLFLNGFQIVGTLVCVCHVCVNLFVYECTCVCVNMYMNMYMGNFVFLLICICIWMCPQVSTKSESKLPPPNPPPRKKQEPTIKSTITKQPPPPKKNRHTPCCVFFVIRHIHI